MGALNENVDLAANLAAFSKTLFGAAPVTTSKSGSTETDSGGTSTKITGTSLTPEAINAMLRDMTEGGLSGQGSGGIAGLAAIMSGQKSAGLYNSATTMQLMNKNATNIAEKVALANTPTVTTSIAPATTKTTTPSTSTVKAPGILSTPAGGIGLGLGALAVLSNKKFQKLVGLDKFLEDDVTKSVATSPAGNAGDFGLPADQLGANFNTTGGEIATKDALGNVVDNSVATSIVDSTPTPIADTFLAAADETASVAAGSGGVDTTSAAEVGAGIDGTAELSTAGEAIFGSGAEGLAAADAVLGADFALPAGIAEAGFFEEVAPLAAAAWVICTELNARKILSDSQYKDGVTYFLNMPKETIHGYRAWAVSYTKLMQRKDWIGRLATALVVPAALARARHINGMPNFLGMITVRIGEPVCWLIGKAITILNLNSYTRTA